MVVGYMRVRPSTVSCMGSAIIVVISPVMSEGSSTENFTATACSSILTLEGWKGHLRTVAFKAEPETSMGLASNEGIDV